MKSPLICSDPVLIEKLVPGGQGIGTVEKSENPKLIGKKGFFWNALPGETVTKYEITKQKSKYFEATALEIKNQSKHRIKPQDNCFLSTSPWQIMDYKYELEQKVEILKELFRQNQLTELVDTKTLNELEVSTDGNDLHYRNKMEYSLWFEKSDEKIHLAFHRRGSHGKIPIEKSSIERLEIIKKAQEIVDELNQKGEEARKYQSLLLRTNQNGEVSGGLFENGKPHPVFDNLKDEILGQEYSYSPNGFFQINLPVYEMALREMKKFINSKNVLDLYSGVGTIGLSIARDKNLTLVEVDKSAYRELERNSSSIVSDLSLSEGLAQRGSASQSATRPWRPPLGTRKAEGLRDESTRPEDNDKLETNIKTILSKSEDVTDFIKPDQTVILDPPRAGIDKKLTEKLLEITPETIIYLSCNPATQARDVKLLSEKYKIIHIKPFNFFPRTPHLENLIVMSRIQSTK